MQRQRTGRSIALTERDIAIFRALRRYRYLRSTYLHAWAGGASVTRFKERLGNLFHEGFLNRPEKQWEFADARNRPAVYELGDRARAALQELDGEQTDQRTFLVNGAAKQFMHALLICECLASIELATLRRSGLRFIGWPEIRARIPQSVERPERLAFKETAIIPDGLFGLGYERAGRCTYRFFAVEVDRGTMPLTRRDDRQTSVMAKLRAYQSVTEERYHHHQWGVPNLLVLVVTTCAHRSLEMVRLASEKGLGPHILFKAIEEWEMLSPCPGLLETPWERTSVPSLNIGESD